MAAVDFQLCLVTDRQATGGRSLPEVVEACLAGGLRAVQLREKDLAAGALLELAWTLRRLTARHDARLLINERIDIALAVGADGVHLPASGMPPAVARRLVSPGRIVGVSTHSAAEAEAAGRAGADFVAFGPVYDTPSKRGYGEPLGLGALREASVLASVPVFAIGGVTPERVPELRAAGAGGVAVIRALLAAPDPTRATIAFLDAWVAAGA